MLKNIILNTDSYKASHFNQYPAGTMRVNSYIESRLADGPDIVFFGLQMFIHEWLSKPITYSDILEAEEIFKMHGEPFNKAGWEHILDAHDGYLPLRIEALPEGMVVPQRTPLVQVRNTDPAVPWLTSYMESALLRAVWYPSTVATMSREVKKAIAAGLTETADDTSGLAFKLHDFGLRGTTCFEQAGIGGLAHLVNFAGTDTVTALLYARQYYDCDMAGYSVAASEHSTMTAWTREGEQEAYHNMLIQNPTGIVSIVADSYDFRHAVDVIIGQNLRKAVLDRDGVTVIRPDSGDPVEEVLFTLESLGKNFGFTTNSKGYRVLNPKVRILQGDGLDVGKINRLLKAVKQNGWSIDNIVMGMGGGLLQKLNRDTFKFAMKASALEDQNGWREVQKDPKTDPTKQSKKGVQSVLQGWGSVHVGSSIEPADDVVNNYLKPVYEKVADRPCYIPLPQTLEQIRTRAAI